VDRHRAQSGKLTGISSEDAPLGGWGVFGWSAVSKRQLRWSPRPGELCAFCKPPVEVPSDWDGVVGVSMDEHDGWKVELAKELKAAGFTVNPIWNRRSDVVPSSGTRVGECTGHAWIVGDCAGGGTCLKVSSRRSTTGFVPLESGRDQLRIKSSVGLLQPLQHVGQINPCSVRASDHSRDRFCRTATSQHAAPGVRVG